MSNLYPVITNYHSANSYQPRPVSKKGQRFRVIGGRRGSSMAIPRIGSRPKPGISTRTSLSSSQFNPFSGLSQSNIGAPGPASVSYDMQSNKYYMACCPRPGYPTTTMRTSCQGSISLYGSGYLRGTNITLTDDVNDFGRMGFDDRLFSLEVRGDCCWKVFTEIGFQGQMMSFKEGQYKSPSAIRKVLKKASSVQKSVYC